MIRREYGGPAAGLPAQSDLMTGRAIFTEAYAVIPKGVMRDTVSSCLPNWERTRLWIVARPLSGFAETFSQYIMQVEAGGGSDNPEPDASAECVLFVTNGEVSLNCAGTLDKLAPGGFAYIPPGCRWSLRNGGSRAAEFHWIRKAYERAEGLSMPDPFVTNEAEIEPVSTPGTNGKWTTTHFVDPKDLRYDMNVNIVNFEPGGTIPFEETHVMEHGLYVLSGKAVYRLNSDWVEVESGDFIWLRAFCPQACYAGGPDRFRYLLYKDVNRHARLGGGVPTTPRIGL